MEWYAIITKSQDFYHPSFMLSSRLYYEMVDSIRQAGADLLVVREKINDKEIEGLMKRVSDLVDNLNRGNPIDLEKELKRLKFTSLPEQVSQAD